MAPPEHQLTSEAAHDLAGALRGLPEALEGLNERIEHASTREDLEHKVFEMQRQQDVHQHEFEERQAATRRRTVFIMVLSTVIAIVIAIAFVILVPVASNRAQVDRTKAQLAILQRATGAAAQRAQQDFSDLLLARLRCQTQQDLQIEYQKVTGKNNLIFDPPACQAVVDSLQQQFNSDVAAVQASSSPPTTARPKSGPGAQSGSPGSTTTTTTQPSPTTTTTSTTQPPPTTPPTTSVVCVTTPVFDGCVHDRSTGAR